MWRAVLQSSLRTSFVATAVGAAFVAQLAPLGLSAQAAPEPTSIAWSTTDRGGVTLLGASSMTCLGSQDPCQRARTGDPGVDGSDQDNDAYDMQWVDRDDDESTTSSSVTQLRLPSGARVLKAVLAWGGTTDSGAGFRADADTVRLRAPGGDYRRVGADAQAQAGDGYQNAADVTGLVRDAGDGAYQVADVAARLAPGSYAGWGLAVAYADADSPERVLSIDTALDDVTRRSSATRDVPGLDSASSSSSSSASSSAARIGLLTWDGDRGRTGDRVEVGGQPLTDGRHPVGNVATSTIAGPRESEDRRLADEPNTFGVDVATFSTPSSASSEGAASGVLRATTDADDFALGVVTGQVDLDASADPSSQEGDDGSSDSTDDSATDPSGESTDGASTDSSTDTADDEAAQATPRRSRVIRGLPETRLPARAVVAAAVVNGVDLATTITGPRVAVPGDELRYVVTVTNNGSADASGPTLQLSSPAPGTSYSVTSAGLTCDTSTWVCTWTSSIAAGTSRQVPVLLQTDPTSAEGDRAGFTATATTTDPDEELQDNVKSVSTRLTLKSDLVLTSTRTSTATPLPGGSIGYRATMRNDGPASAVAPTLSVYVPFADRTSYVATAGAVCSPVSDGALVCRWSSLPTGQSRSIDFAVRTSPWLLRGFELPMTASGDADNATAERERVLTTAISDSTTRSIDVSVSQTVTKVIKAGKEGTWRVVVTNHGPYRAHNLVITTTPPQGITWINADGTTSAKYVRRLSYLQPGARFTITTPITSASALSGVLTTKVTQADPDLRRANNTATSRFRVTGSAISTKAGTVTPIKVTSTSKSSTTTTTTPVDTTLYDDAGQAIPGTGSNTSTTSTAGGTVSDESLAETGGPQGSTMWLGLLLVLMGVATSTSARERRPAPRHRAARTLW